MTESPDFSGFAESYARWRPSYPAELFAWLAAQVSRRDCAWDCATGNGQAASGLAQHFERVIGTDQSEGQILHAQRHARVEYRVASAEDSGIPEKSVDLVVAAAALHWFDRPRFYEEARRVVRAGGVLAAWTYHVAHVASPLGEILWPFYRDVVGSHFAPGARLVDDRYQAIELPGRSLATPSFAMTASWTAAEILSFVKTWSGVQAYMKTTGRDPVTEIAPRVQALCSAQGPRCELRWPLYLRASKLEDSAPDPVGSVALPR